jgi:methylenetetrahydrofolate--tRNA-(uracil-5-)-methyltransferase
MDRALVIGAGLAGSEAAWQLAQRGIKVELYEMKPHKRSPAHHSSGFAELVCSNSLKADRLDNANGLLKEELRRLGSLIICAADATRVEAGGALAVDREDFSALVTKKISSHPNIKIIHREVEKIPEDSDVIVATGPLTSESLSEQIAEITGQGLYFYDAAAPIIAFSSIDMQKAFFASRYDKGTPDYINCPMNEQEYEAFYSALIAAEEAPVHSFEKTLLFEGCMPIEFMAARGRETMRYGPLKPVGLTDPKTGKMPYAVVQLRRDNRAGTLYNMVGFQTHLKFGEQKRVFSMIPALEKAEFERYGVMHRNTFLNSPKLLDRYYRLKSRPRISFAGQMTGVEGYVASASSGYLASVELARRLSGRPPVDFPPETAIGALADYISGGGFRGENFQPMNINFGIISPLERKVKGKRNRNIALSERSLEIIDKIKADFQSEGCLQEGNYENHS